MAKFNRKESTYKNIHTIALYDLRKRFEFDLTTGLSSSRAQELLKKRRIEETKHPYRRIFKMSFMNLVQVFSLVILLSLLCLVLYYEPIGGDSPDITNLVSFVLILICFFTTPLLIVFQEYMILKETLWLEKYQTIAQSKVMRDSNWVKIPSNELVIGDIVEITANQHVPADLRLFSVNGLSFDKSILTGKTESIEASLNNLEHASYYEAKNMAFKNFWVVSGNGRGIVIATGTKNDYINRTTFNSYTGKNDPSRKAFIQIGFGVLFISMTCVGIYLIVWVSFLRTNYTIPLNTVISNVFNIIITGVPYNLAVSIIIGYLINIRKLNKLHILTKESFSLDSMNSIDVVVTDKSGTITKNAYEVTNVFLCHREIDLNRYLHSHSHSHSSFFQQFLNVIDLAIQESSNIPNEIAMLRFVKKYRTPESKNPRNYYKLIEMIEFSSSNMYQAMLYQNNSEVVNNGEVLLDNDKKRNSLDLIIGGITDFLLPKCTYMMNTKGLDNEKTDENIICEIQAKIDKWASIGRKVICFCKKTIDEETFKKAKKKPNFNFQKWFNSECANLTFVGMVGLMDPPQPGIKDTVNQIFELGLRVIMVTGDYSLTSVSMAAQAGIFSSKKYDTLNKFRQNKANNISYEFSYTRGILLNGAEIDNLSKEEFGLIYSEYYQMIVCRATPNHKIQLIKLLQSNKKSVLMVGDGLNDVSALKQADQSVAMNSGSKLAADVSNIILLNNSFNSIYDLLLIGRKNILNNQKAFMFCLTSVFTQYASTLPSSLFGIPQLYSNLQMVLLNTFLDFLPTMTLLFEKSDSASIKSAGNMRIFNFKIVVFSLLLGLITTFFAYLVFFFYLFKFGEIQVSNLFFNYIGDVYLNHHFIVAQSVAFYTIVIIHMFGNLYSIRTMYKSIFETVPVFGTYSNIYLVTSSVLVAVFMILIVTFPIPGLTVNIIPLFYVLPFIGSILIISVIEFFRFVFLRKKIFPFND